MELLNQILSTTGFASLYWGNFVMWGVAFIFLYLAIVKGFEPLLLVPIAFGMLLANIPSNIMTPGEGLLWRFYHYGEEWETLYARSPQTDRPKSRNLFSRPHQAKRCL